MKTSAGDDQLKPVEYRAAKEMTKAQSYAASLVELAKAEGSLDRVDQDIRLVKATLAEHINLKTALTDSGVPVEQQQRVVEEIFSDKVARVTLNFIRLLIGMGQVGLLPEIADEFARRLEAVENKIIAEVTTAVPMEKQDVDRVAERLSALAGRDVTVRSTVDSSMVGGIVVRMGGKLLDGSVRNQLERLKAQMLIDMRGR